MQVSNLIEACLIVGGASYIGSLLWLLRGLYRREECALPSLKQPSLSIIVAARNEEQTIAGCLEALCQQDYEGEWEVLVVDDRSTDGTEHIVNAWASEWPRLHLVRAPDEVAFRCAKKSALAQGIAVARGEILLFTDADCRPPPNWARSMADHFHDDVGLVAGHAHTEAGHALMQRVLSAENAAVGGLAAGSFAQGVPLSCTGRNLAYRKAVYDEVDGFQRIGHLLGGDDVYFMRLVAAGGRWKMVFNRRAVVSSLPSSAQWRRIVHQKMRHAAKGGHYRGPALLLAALVYAFHVGLGAGLVAELGGIHLEWLWPIWAARWFVDALLLRHMARLHPLAWGAYLPLLEVLYIPYVVFLAPAGRLGLFRWKV